MYLNIKSKEFPPSHLIFLKLDIIPRTPSSFFPLTIPMPIPLRTPSPRTLSSRWDTAKKQAAAHSLRGFTWGCIEYFCKLFIDGNWFASPTADSCTSEGSHLGLGQGRRRWLIHPPVTQFLAVSKVKQSEWLSRAAANRAQRPTTMAGATMPKRTQ